MSSGIPALLRTFAVVAVLLTALLPLAQSSSRQHHHHGRHSHVQSTGHAYDGGVGEVTAAKGREARAWPCCDSCGGCTKSIPPQCQCLDAVRGGCHPACRDCVKSALSVDPPVYQCMDRLPNFCQHRCSAVAAH